MSMCALTAPGFASSKLIIFTGGGVGAGGVSCSEGSGLLLLGRRNAIVTATARAAAIRPTRARKVRIENSSPVSKNGYATASVVHVEPRQIAFYADRYPFVNEPAL